MGYFSIPVIFWNLGHFTSINPGLNNVNLRPSTSFSNYYQGVKINLFHVMNGKLKITQDITSTVDLFIGCGVLFAVDRRSFHKLANTNS